MEFYLFLYQHSLSWTNWYEIIGVYSFLILFIFIYFIIVVLVVGLWVETKISSSSSFNTLTDIISFASDSDNKTIDVRSIVLLN